jgi:BirA family transcriptional regulator, biotin operon repressor / biotin---[acetyl-CoA-carboxylase] ligase
VSDDDLQTLVRHLRTRTFGRAHEHHADIESTNERAASWAGSGAPHGALVTADAQRRGRGRRGRAWHSPPGENLYASVVVRPGPVGEGLGAIGLAVAVGLREALPQPPGGISLKWPNDLLIGERKLGGILCESRWCGDTPEVVIGFGINVHTTRFPEALVTVATSLSQALPAGRVPARAPLLADLLASLEDTVASFFDGGFRAIRARYEPHCIVMGRVIELDDVPGGRRRVVAHGLDHDGALLVRPTAGGALQRIEAADVWMVPR